MWFKVRVAFFVLFLLLCSAAFIYFNFLDGYGTGSPEEAAKMRMKLESITSPEAGIGCDREYIWKRFDSGEWVLGICRDSHAFWGKYTGGTVVLKDSRGKTGTYFGHVCGHAPMEMPMHRAYSLDEFYTELLKYTPLKEQP
jgi:hypothetical protein